MKQGSITYALELTHKGLQELQPEEMPLDKVLTSANGELHFLVKRLAEEHLSEEEQGQIETILNRYSKCVYTALARVEVAHFMKGLRP